VKTIDKLSFEYKDLERKTMTENSEQTIFSNSYGTITTKRVTYFRKKGWFSGGSREDVPLKQVVSVRYDTKRHIFVGLFFLFLGLVFVSSGNGVAILIGIVFILWGILNLWGGQLVDVVTTGGTNNLMVGLPWDKEAEEFVRALRGQLFSE